MSGRSTNDAAPPEQLAQVLRRSRELLGLSIRAAAARTGLSGTYLSQLEAAAIKEPSPRVLYKFAEAYGISYTDLMRTAGYIMPGAKGDLKPSAPASPLDIALRTAAPLSDDEREALAEYLAWYRSRHGRPPEKE